MSGYDALDELYERLRGQEDAQRAGGITPETIRAARGGVAGEIGRIPATAAESAARADSAPMVDISRDSRERINADASELVADYARNGSVCDALYDGILDLLDRQAALTERGTEPRDACEDTPDSREKIADDLEKLIKEWDDYDGDYIRIFGGVAYAQVKELLDRQATLTEREWGSATANERIVELRKKVNALAVERDELRARLDALRPPRTVEDVLRDLVEEWGAWDGCDSATERKMLERYAAEIRGLLEVER